MTRTRYHIRHETLQGKLRYYGISHPTREQAEATARQQLPRGSWTVIEREAVATIYRRLGSGDRAPGALQARIDRQLARGGDDVGDCSHRHRSAEAAESCPELMHGSMPPPHQYAIVASDDRGQTWRVAP